MLTQRSRTDLWQTVADGVTAGCPVPNMTYISSNGLHTTLSVESDRDVLAWALYFGIPTVTVRIYPTDSGGFQRSFEAERDDPWLSIANNTHVNGPACEDEYPLITCPGCGQPMTTYLPSVSVFPGDPVVVERTYHCQPCNHWHQHEVTDPAEQDRVWACTQTDYNPDLYPAWPVSTQEATSPVPATVQEGQTP